jgi:hypothetical protein
VANEATKIFTKLLPIKIVVNISLVFQIKTEAPSLDYHLLQLAALTLLAGILINAASAPEKKADRNRPKDKDRNLLYFCTHASTPWQ